MQVILLERIGRLGQMGDVVTVKDGYARNFLLPQGKALRATAANRERFENERAQLEAHNLEQKKEADAVAAKMDGENFIVIRQAGDTGQLYGSVSTRDIADNVTAAGFEIERRQVLLDRPIKILGLHPVRVALHPEVEVTVTINVARSEDEAARQARGEDVTAMAEEEAVEEEETISVEEVFEDKELAKEVEETLKEEELEAGADEEAVAAESKGEEEASPAAEEKEEEGEDAKSGVKDA
jgi:large subunit ribosomal protein L9